MSIVGTGLAFIHSEGVYVEAPHVSHLMLENVVRPWKDTAEWPMTVPVSLSFIFICTLHLFFYLYTIVFVYSSFTAGATLAEKPEFTPCSSNTEKTFTMNLHREFVSTASSSHSSSPQLFYNAVFLL
jgi:hypothetical protein